MDAVPLPGFIVSFWQFFLAPSFYLVHTPCLELGKNWNFKTPTPASPLLVALKLSRTPFSNNMQRCDWKVYPAWLHFSFLSLGLDVKNIFVFFPLPTFFLVYCLSYLSVILLLWNVKKTPFSLPSFYCDTLAKPKGKKSVSVVPWSCYSF